MRMIRIKKIVKEFEMVMKMKEKKIETAVFVSINY